jgi:hypothetical protein
MVNVPPDSKMLGLAANAALGALALNQGEC